MITIYHNPRCSKSREALHYLQNKGVDFKVVKYLDNPLNSEQLKDLLKKLKMSPIQLVRTNEAVWKENYKDKNLSDEQIVNAMVEHPKLIQRPIVVNGNKAVVARPAEEIDKIL